jgi:ubiquinone/menaquinone biosynthesis C-methylase UbiE
MPPGVSREVWDYLHDSTLARRYDESLAGTPLLELDRRFVERHCPAPGRLIDLGCGTGRLAVPLAVRGDRVTAVDLSQEMLRVAGEKAAAAGVILHRLQANVVALDGIRDSVFDYALCLFATLGMVSGSDARRKAIGNAYRVLRSGGVFVLHVHGRWHHLWTRAGRRWLLKDFWTSAGGRPDAGDWRMEHQAGQTGWVIHLFSRGEAVGLLRRAGFEIVELLPVGLSSDGRLRWPWLFGAIRAYGFLIAARRPR